MCLRKVFIVALSVLVFSLSSFKRGEAQLVEVNLSADDANSDLGLADPKADLVEFTLEDPFAYDPNDPTSASPVQDFMVENNYHASGAPSGNVANLFYDFSLLAGGETFVVDLWGRLDDPNSQFRDDDFDVFLRSGGFDGDIVEEQYRLGIPDGAEAYLRVTFDQIAGEFDTLEIAGYDVFFTLMEVRAAATNARIPEPSAMALVAAIACFGFVPPVRRRID